eukprot:5116104-Pleurochrysis_carterae.AAC.1
MLPMRTISQTGILHHSRGRFVISISVNTTYSLADCCSQLDLEIVAAAAQLDNLLPSRLRCGCRYASVMNNIATHDTPHIVTILSSSRICPYSCRMTRLSSRSSLRSVRELARASRRARLRSSHDRNVSPSGQRAIELMW